MLLRNFIERFKRYTRTFYWLWTQQYLGGTRRLALTIILDLLSRMSNMLTLIVTLKCAVWLVKPPTVPGWLAAYLPKGIEGPLLVPLLFLLPASVMLGSAVVSRFHAVLSNQLRSEVATKIAIRAIEAELNVVRDKKFSEQVLRAKINRITTAFETLVARLLRVEVAFLTSIVSCAALSVAVCLGLYLDPFLTVATLSAGLIGTLVLIAHRHTRVQFAMNLGADLKSSCIAERAKLRQGLLNWASDPACPSTPESISRDFVSIVRDMRTIDVRLRDSANIMFGAGQSVLLFWLLLLIYMRGLPTDASQLGMIAIVLIILRSALGLLRNLGSSAANLSRDYPVLVELAENRSIINVVTLSEIDEEDRPR